MTTVRSVRDAVNYAIDRQLIIDTIASGSGEPADAIIAPAVFGYFSPGAYEYDPEKAKSLLAEAGYPNGFETSIWVNAVSYTHLDVYKRQLLVRYGHYMINMLHGDLGTSYKNNLSVWSQVMERFPNTARCV